MLQFYSANARGANTVRVLDTCLKRAFDGQVPHDLQLMVVYATLGHKLENVNRVLNEKLPGVPVLGASCGGVVGPDGVGESMNELGIFAISGPAHEVAYVGMSNVTMENTGQKMTEMATELKEKLPGLNAAFLVVPGMEARVDAAVEGFDGVLTGVPLFGGIASDNMKGITSYQLLNGQVDPSIMWLAGIADSTLATVNRATHGFTVIGEPMEVTASDGVRILELNGTNAWKTYGERFKLAEDSSPAEIVAFGAVAQELPPEYWEEYGSKYLLHGLKNREDDGSLVYRVGFAPGTKLRLAIRDEALIFSEMRRILDEMRAQADGEFVAVLQSDCIARGRFSLDAVSKDELIGMMQDTLVKDDGSKAAWLGMYGFGEFLPLHGRNYWHTYTTSLMAIYRKRQS